MTHTHREGDAEHTWTGGRETGAVRDREPPSGITISGRVPGPCALSAAPARAAVCVNTEVSLCFPMVLAPRSGTSGRRAVAPRVGVASPGTSIEHAATTCTS